MKVCFYGEAQFYHVSPPNAPRFVVCLRVISAWNENHRSPDTNEDLYVLILLFLRVTCVIHFEYFFSASSEESSLHTVSTILLSSTKRVPFLTKSSGTASVEEFELRCFARSPPGGHQVKVRCLAGANHEAVCKVEWWRCH